MRVFVGRLFGSAPRVPPGAWAVFGVRYTEGMSGRHALRAALPVLACVLVLFAQVTGAHLHLCLDGGEAPISAHLSAAPAHHDHHSPGPAHHDQHHDGAHTDLDLAWVGDVLAKPHVAVSGAPPVLAAPWRLSLALASPGPHAPATAARPLACARPHLRPPLRAPPPIPA